MLHAQSAVLHNKRTFIISDTHEAVTYFAIKIDGLAFCAVRALSVDVKETDAIK